MIEDSVDRLLEQWRQERPGLDVSDLGLVVRIERLTKLLHRGNADALAGLGLKPWEYDCLSALRRQGAPYELPATELARASLLTTGTVTTRIDQLEARGLVERGSDPEDRRSVLVKLTKAGLALVDEAFKARLSAAESGLAGLKRAQRGRVDSGLRQLLLSLEQPAES